MINATVRRPAAFSPHTAWIVLAFAVSTSGFVREADAQQAVAVEDQTVRTNTGTIKDHAKDIKNSTHDMSNQIGGSTSGSDEDTVNGHLKHIDTLGNAPSGALSTLGAPEVDLKKITPPISETGSCKGLTKEQIKNCEDIVETKNAQYKYMKSVYDMAAERQKTLNSLQETRRGLKAEEFGKLQDNSNQTLTLIAQIQIDRQQMDSINAAYQARIDFLKDQQKQLAQSAAEPTTGTVLGNLASQAVAGYVLKKALDVQSSDDATRVLSIEKSGSLGDQLLSPFK